MQWNIHIIMVRHHCKISWNQQKYSNSFLLSGSSKLSWHFSPFVSSSLQTRYKDDLPGVDIFVCTADPTIEPPMLVVNTVLSLIAYDYPSDKLAIYLSDDGGSDLTFYALLEASHFAKDWIPFCKKFKVDPRSPSAYFSQASEPLDFHCKEDWSTMKVAYWSVENASMTIHRKPYIFRFLN